MSVPVELPNGNASFSAIHIFFLLNFRKGYTLSLYDQMEQATVEVMNEPDTPEVFEEIIQYASIVEHDFPEWIGVNEISESFVVGFNFTRGVLETNSVYRWEDGQLVKVTH